jgi:hypothetical protein
MKGMLFVELTDRNEKDFRDIIAKQKEYSIFPDGFEDLFRINPKIHLRSEVLNLLGIIDLWNGIGGRKREFWSLSDASNALQQFEIPLRDFISRIGEFNNYESIKSSLGIIHDVVLLFTNYDEFLLDQKDSLIRNLATIERAFLDPKKSKGKSEMYMLGVKFSMMFKELNKYPEYLKMEDQSSKDKYEVDHISDHDFFQFKNLLELGFDGDIAAKFLNPNLLLSDKEKSHKLIILFEHPALKLKVNQVLAVVGAEVKPTLEQNASPPLPPPLPKAKVATNSIVGAFLSESARGRGDRQK